ncbi:MAG: VPLPA-CTERM sorting domain-containing protein [Syntrophaceae bacterium]|nr:VPLPA-CTERM sorting domain-containing protein [Syntrophaceae bacterium]
MRRCFLTFSLLLALLIGTNAQAAFFAGTDRVSYTGTVTRYETLADAQSGVNATGTYAIPARDAAAPYNTGFRDAGIFFSNNAPDYWPNASIFLTAWYYTTDPSHGEYSGWGNPNNTNTGFIQLYDETGGTSTSANGYFSNLSGGYYRDFTLQVTGQNAGAAEYARLWHAPGVGGEAGLTRGTFLNYNLNITFGGLQGMLLPGGWIESHNHPESVTGTFMALFQNTNTIDPAYQGYYVANFTFGLDNWAFAQGEALNGAFSESTFAAPVPIPPAAWLLGSGLIGLVAIRRRIKK